MSYLEEERKSDVVYADYYYISDENLPVGHHSVPGPQLLYRRDVVGPCFLVRRAFVNGRRQLAADASLARV